MEDWDQEYFRLVRKRIENPFCQPNWGLLPGKTPEEIALVYQETLEAGTHLHHVFDAESLRRENIDGEPDHKPSVSSPLAFFRTYSSISGILGSFTTVVRRKSSKC